VVAIDHVLTRAGAAATSVRTYGFRDSDYRSLLVHVTLPER
jgi:hypothetical protein